MTALLFCVMAVVRNRASKKFRPISFDHSCSWEQVSDATKLEDRRPRAPFFVFSFCYFSRLSPLNPQFDSESALCCGEKKHRIVNRLTSGRWASRSTRAFWALEAHESFSASGFDEYHLKSGRSPRSEARRVRVRVRLIDHSL